MKPKKKPEQYLWTITVNDGFCAWEYTIHGSPNLSIADIAECVARKLRGKITGKRRLEK